MATISLDLYRLIEGLSRTEKAYFKKFGYKYDKGEGKQELQLFNWIDKTLKKTDELDDGLEEKIQRQFSKQFGSSTYSKKKTNLYYDILASLREYEKGKIIEERILEFYRYAQILIKRNLFKEALPFVKKASTLAKEYELFELEILIAHQYSILVSRLNPSKSGKESIEKLDAALASIAGLEEIFKMERSYFELAYLQKTKGVITEESDLVNLKQENEELLNHGESSNSRAELYRLEALSTIAILKGSQQDSFQAYRSILDLLDKSSYLRQNNLEKYIILYDQYMQMSLLTFNIEEFEKKYEVFQLLEVSTLQEKAWKENASVFVECIYAVLDNKLELFEELEGRFLSIINKMPRLIPSYRKISTSYYMITGFFMKNDWGKVGEWYFFIHNNRNLGVRYDVDMASRIMQILALFESGAFDQMEVQLKSFRNFIASKSRYAVDAILSSLFGKLLHERSQDAFEAIYKSYYEKIQEHLKEHPKDAKFLGVFDMLSWLKAKANREEFYPAWRKGNIPE